MIPDIPTKKEDRIPRWALDRGAELEKDGSGMFYEMSFNIGFKIYFWPKFKVELTKTYPVLPGYKKKTAAKKESPKKKKEEVREEVKTTRW